ncbi:helix-turn-helix transcriptional regulator [Desulfurispira natronophila]|uniref:Prophage regulatory protein n=1 Tax=Desulfurispira natronophila TaxID=682562 RepID=A0A7W8DHJ8_9BACT|nr:AlpA family phage regulatory protein [Desulfurispira natronophila]MBB5022636.1 prophage regulatory protein [Desulfurispira natronophila]
MQPAIDPIIRMKDTVNLTGLSRSTIYRKMQDGSFPTSFKISKSAAGWRMSTIRQWMEQQEQGCRGVQHG